MRYNSAVVDRQVDFSAPQGTTPKLGHPQNPANPFRIRTSAKYTNNSFGIRTSKIKDLKSFRIRTYEKTREGTPLQSA
jgi:hypothetical protein